MARQDAEFTRFARPEKICSSALTTST
jgi:hypothetical protein